MTKESPVPRAEQLISFLVANPSKCAQEGKTYELLEEYFDGLPLSTLRPLLSNKDPQVRGAAVWIASELGKDAKQVLHDVIPLLHDMTPYTRADALDVVMVCAVDEDVREFVHLVIALTDSHPGIRQIAMFLVSNAESSQIEAALHLYDSLGPSNELHRRGLKVLSAHDPVAGEIWALIEDSEPLIRKYGVVAARRFVEKFPELIQHAASSSDEEISHFALARANDVRTV